MGPEYWARLYGTSWHSAFWADDWLKQQQPRRNHQTSYSAVSLRTLSKVSRRRSQLIQNQDWSKIPLPTFVTSCCCFIALRPEPAELGTHGISGWAHHLACGASPNLFTAMAAVRPYQRLFPAFCSAVCLLLVAGTTKCQTPQKCNDT